jgi:UDP-N-acetylglucosamine 2-epimerase (non-hydrolysing)
VTHILLVSGTRPEVIKLAPVHSALQASGWARVSWLHTGQHDEMATQALACFNITPEVVLTRQGDSLSAFTTGCRAQLDDFLTGQQIDAVVVQGDTESAFVGALAAFYNGVPVAHVEAGLRTYDLTRPFPEEAVRQMISRISRWHFAPTAAARDALLREGIAGSQVFVTGNTVIDAQRMVRDRGLVARRVEGRGHLLVTAHRRESWGDEMASICDAIATIAAAHPDLPILFPVHLNPAVREPVHAKLNGLPNISLSPPFDYLQTQQALADAWLVMTDSGGLQEEAPTFGVPVLVLRRETERAEAVDAGFARMIGTAASDIVAAVEQLRHDPAAYAAMRADTNPFGDGHAAARVVDILARDLAAGSDVVEAA